jgi:enoyl-CoA hydratase
MGFATIKFDRPEPGIGVVTLSRPDRLNAINLSMVDDLSRLFHDLSRDESVRVLILTGEGRAFCSGADLKDEGIRHQSGRMLSSASDFLVAVQKRYADMVLDMRRIPQPVIAAVNGAAAGGGLCLALASDVAYACPDAVFIPSFVNIGLSGGELGTSFFLPRAVGKTRAAEILMTGRNVHAAEAERIGLVCRVVEGPRLMDAALETARIMLEKSPMGLRLTKEALNQNMNAPSLEAAVELENRNQSICCCDPGFADAVQKFREGS